MYDLEALSDALAINLFWMFVTRSNRSFSLHQVDRMGALIGILERNTLSQHHLPTDFVMKGGGAETTENTADGGLGWAKLGMHH